MWRIRTTVADAPGRLGALCLALAERDVNIVAIHVRPHTRLLPDSVVDEFVVIAPGALDAGQIALAMTVGGGVDTEVWAFDGDDLLDVPTPAWAAGLSPRDLSSPGLLAATGRTRL